MIHFLNIDSGTSVSVDGVCLTVRDIEDNNLEFQISNESKDRSIINGYKNNVNVNLELPTTVNDFLSGHIVQGHVDEISEVLNITEDNKDLWTFEFNINNSKYFLEILDKELKSFRSIREEMISEYSLEDYDYIVDGWNDKVQRVGKGDQCWGYFKAKKMFA